MKESSSTKPQEQEKPEDITPSARGCSKRNGPYFVGDLLWWQASETELVYTLERINRAVTIADFKTQNMHFSWDFGYRAGVGYNFNYDKWDLYAQWTHFNSDATTKKTTGQPNLFPTYLAGPENNIETTLNTIGQASHARSHWHLQFNVVDAELGRSLFISRKLSLRPAIGAKAAWIKKKNNFFYRDMVDPFQVVSNGEYKIHTRHAAVGPRLSLDGKWHLGWGFGLIAKGAGSVLWADWHFKSSAAIVHAGTFLGGKLWDKKTFAIPVIESLLGLDWGRCFCQNKYFINFSVGYEIQYWWTRLDPVSAMIPRMQDNLQFQGVTATGRFDF